MQPSIVQRRGPDAVVTLDRPAKLNALDEALVDRLEAALVEVEVSDARALILTGAGRAFCAGTDVSGTDGPVADPVAHAEERIARMHRLVLRLIDFPVVTVAACNGLAYGGGLELALACTFRVAAPGTLLALPEVHLGLIPSYGGTQLLPRLIGSSPALRMMLTGEPVTADEALGLGLVDVVDEDVLAAAGALADRLPAGTALAQRLIRRAVREGGGRDLRAALDVERRLALQVDAGEVAARFAARRASS
jgi:enoyl-CoA hydratase/carnithine racemase